jgi:acyl carrier protein phosphodiesterase
LRAKQYLTKRMNFLAHLYLSGNDPLVRLGNFIGDFVKGRDLADRYEPAIVKGIELHRLIDGFTDQHPLVKQSKIRLRPKYRHYAPVIVDMYYDHFLAAGWAAHSVQLLPDFAKECYDMLERNVAVLPAQVKALLPHIVRGNWLVSYGKMEGIHRALSGMARRSRFDSKMDESVIELENSYAEFKAEFEEFFPLLKNYSNDFLSIP